ncbi:ABC transporter ATP-binding protein [Cohnella sp. REN36]|uniref:ABC transporter ATP-binding protein n=1 Tax=Cohnella sp. REN36 TaxID=2887347 RepID=UPI001D132B4D|nr:ABC transporter ATP-binding protein [Cohnella sp. REN36]MCC3376010.1 ABC transporter ATP-binding protein/permease [Cohnella sp. REN36]
MKELIFYFKKLHASAGIWLYINLIGMILISSLEGIGIYLLVPMLSIMGSFNVDLGSIPYVDRVMSALHRIDPGVQLPLLLGIYAVIIIGQALLQRLQQMQSSRINQTFIRLLRLDIYQQLLASSWHFFVRKRKSDFYHILTNELARVAVGTVQAMTFLTSIVFTVIQIGLALVLSAKLTLLVLACGIGFVLFSRRFVRSAKRLGARMTDLSQGYFAAVNDSFNGIKDIKSNRMEATQLQWFRRLNRQMEDNANQFVRNQSMSQFFYKVASALLIVLFVFVSFEVMHVKTEQLVMIVLIFTRLWPRFTSLQNSIEQMVAAIPAFRSLNDLHRECEAVKEMDIEAQASQTERFEIRHSLVCQNVSFRFDRQSPVYALQDIELTIPANRTTAIVGKSGAGKSTLIDVLIGLFEPERGAVLIDGVPLSRDKLTSFRNSISYVSQDPFLFNASIRDNLTMVAPNAGESELWQALTFAAARDFVEKLPQGLDTVLGDRGIRLSGGERQRIVLARAMLRKPSILVLDEATSALDNENEAIIQKALDRLKGSLTIVVIAHRLSTIRNADQVVVVEQGQIIQQGEYVQLSKESKGMFSRLLAYQAEA